MAEKRTIELEVKANVKNVASDMKGVTNATIEAKKATTDLGEASKDAASKGKGFAGVKDGITSMVPGLKNAEGGVNSLSKSLKLLLANPVVLVISAIVAGLALLFKAFTSTKEGADKFAQLMAGLSAIIDVVRDRILNVGNAIIKFFSGDFKGALNEGKKAVSGFGDEVAKEFKAAANATKQLQQVEDAFNRLSVSRARVNRDLAISKELLTDENASFEEKRKALEKIKKTEGEQTKQELQNARKKYKAIQALNALSDTSREDKKKEQDALIALIALEEQSARDRRAINKQEKILDNQEKAAKKEADDAAKARHKEYLDRQKEQQKAREESLKKIKEAEKEYQDSLLTQQQRELNEANNKYTELINLAIKNGQDTAILEEAKNKKISDINAKFAKLELEEKKKLEEAKKALEAKQIADMKAADDAATKQFITAEEIKIAAMEDGLDKQAAIRKLAYDKEQIELQNKLDAELITMEQFQTASRANNKVYQDGIKADNEAALKAQVDADKAAYEQKAAIQNQYADIANQAANLVKEILGKGKAAQKTAVIIESSVGIAKMVIANKLANIGALATPQAIATSGVSAVPVITANNISTALGIAANVAATAKALKEIGGGGSAPSGPSAGGGGGGTSGGGTGGGVMAPNFNVVGNNGINQLAQLQQQPIKAYVVGAEVTTQQALDRNRVTNATL